MELNVVISEISMKLRHEVSEIRERALDSLFFKLKHGILSFGDVVHHYELIRALLEWFNFQKVHREDEVLSLLVQFSVDALASRMILEMEGDIFLEHMKQHLRTRKFPESVQTIETILSALKDPKHIEIWKRLDESHILTDGSPVLWDEEKNTFWRLTLENRLKASIQKGELGTMT
jgi:hypothetical protein